MTLKTGVMLFDAENSALHHRNTLHLNIYKNKIILNCNHISQYYCLLSKYFFLLNKCCLSEHNKLISLTFKGAIECIDTIF